MHFLIVLAIAGLLGASAWDLRDGSLDMLPGEQYGSVKSNAKTLPFRVQTPSYIPKGFNFLKKESLALLVGNSAGIPQINLLYESSDGKNGETT